MIGRCFQFGTFLKVFENESFIPWKLYEYELLLTLRVDFLIDGHIQLGLCFQGTGP